MSECSSGKCDVGENPARKFAYVYRCSNDNCAMTIPINEENYNLFKPEFKCPKCGNLLIWYPKEWVSMKDEDDMDIFEKILAIAERRLKENPDDEFTQEFVFWFLWMWFGKIIWNFKKVKNNERSNTKL
jgi:hypothetical protein